ncbi:hypothetical protein RHMOL_Rhmol04G0271900 [Rhododendron molle]|uniref:Uncharacterized protein n=1 Tax=Rhododendron molle TaxID=49168 RepID=A0ACC0P6G2_RHOML|nr:hypothetical protein RHMOL_Rhmol04G0271900 [Rhododendron molle]
MNVERKDVQQAHCLAKRALFSFIQSRVADIHHLLNRVSVHISYSFLALILCCFNRVVNKPSGSRSWLGSAH